MIRQRLQGALVGGAETGLPRSRNSAGIRSRRILTASSFALILGVAGAALSQPAGSAAPPPTAPAGAMTAPGATPPPAGSVSAAAGSSSAPSTTAAPSTPPASSGAPTAAPSSHGLPPPSADQLAALAEMQKEADAYEKAARDYRSTITRIVQHHYEDRKRRILTALDTEITTESKVLADAREEAIKKHEEFVAKYSGANAHPENTPD